MKYLLSSLFLFSSFSLTADEPEKYPALIWEENDYLFMEFEGNTYFIGYPLRLEGALFDDGSNLILPDDWPFYFPDDYPYHPEGLEAKEFFRGNRITDQIEYWE